MNKKLKNKETGEVGDLIGSVTSCPFISIGVDFHDGDPKTYHYNSIAELNEHWEDYEEPEEPLIKDEKIRKAVRAWAESNGIEQVAVERSFSTYTFSPADTDRVSVSVWTDPSLSNLSKDKTYTITELCGEEEE